MAKILLVNPSYHANYASARAGIVNPIHPTLGLAAIAAEALRRGHRVRILDLSSTPYAWRSIRATILAEKPDIIGITATTPLFNQLRDLSMLCKDISPDILVVGGGAHLSAMPVQGMHESAIDMAVAGEGDPTFGEICDGRDPARILGVYRRDGNGQVIYNGPRPPSERLDDLPVPAWQLYDPAVYKHQMSRLLARRPPVTMAEFSRGCVFKCDFCASKMTMALGYRKKSPGRCADEVRELHRQGWREFMLADDIFTSDQHWANEVCEAIRRTGVDMAWSCTNGIRVESANEQLFRNMRAAGCYRVSFGFESGNDQVLREFGKGGKATLEQGREAVRLARAAGLDTSGYFLLGLSSDTEATMRDTIAFARSLELDMLKFGVTVAFPGTPMFRDYAQRGLIRSFDWDDYHIYSDRPLFAHPRLTHETVQRYMERAYREVIFRNPAFIARRVKHALRTGELFWDAYYYLRFISAPATGSESRGCDYYAKDRWPRYDHAGSQPVFPDYQTAGKKSRTRAAVFAA